MVVKAGAVRLLRWWRVRVRVVGRVAGVVVKAAAIRLLRWCWVRVRGVGQGRWRGGGSRCGSTGAVVLGAGSDVEQGRWLSSRECAAPEGRGQRLASVGGFVDRVYRRRTEMALVPWTVRKPVPINAATE